MNSLIPGSVEILEAMSSRDAKTSGSAPTDGPIACAVELYLVNRQLWLVEDECRVKNRSVSEIGTLKMRVDELNLLRSDLIDTLDGSLPAWMFQGDVPLHTETVGSVVDRLSIATIRAEQLGRKGDARVERARCQLRILGSAYDQLVLEVCERRRRLPSWRALKAYGPTSGQ